MLNIAKFEGSPSIKPMYCKLSTHSGIRLGMVTTVTLGEDGALGDDEDDDVVVDDIDNSGCHSGVAGISHKHTPLSIYSQHIPAPYRFFLVGESVMVDLISQV